MHGELTVEIGENIKGSEVQVLAFMLGEKLRMVSPEDAAVRIHLENQNSTCSVMAADYDFFAESVESDPQAALRDLDHEIMLQMTAWKTARL